jgi:hypothetical protein
MLHVSARSFRTVLLAATLATMVAAPAAAAPAPVVPAAGTTADTPPGTAAAKEPGDKPHKYTYVAGSELEGSAHAKGTIEVTKTKVSVTEGELRNLGGGRAKVVFTVTYWEGSRGKIYSLPFRYGRREREEERKFVPTNFTFSATGHGVIESVHVSVCHWHWARRPPETCSKLETFRP